MFGKLSLSDIPYHEPILVGTFIGVVVVAVLALAAITYFRAWGYLWKEWFTSVDHKKIGIMYIVVAIIMLVRGFADAVMMTSQQALATGGAAGYLPPHHYDQIFTAHGVVMIFFVATPLVIGLMNIVVPLQIGARDLAFPFLNSVAFWFTVAGAMLCNISLFVGEFAKMGWVGYPPLSELQFSPGVGVDYYIWAVQASGVGTLLTGVNFVTTILKMRSPSMPMFKMPVFTWTVLCSNIIICAVFPMLTAAVALLSLDRYLGFHFFTAEMGGNAMMYVNLVWAWGHPEVYLLILPAFGVFSEVCATFARKPLFGYHTMVWASVVITFLSVMVWLHHFFTMGSGANVNAFFGIATMIIAIPTGVKLFNWIFTLYRGRITYSVPMLWTIFALVTFTIGGMTGVFMSIPAADFMVHNTLFLVAHFHNTIIGGAVAGYLAGVAYWFPKATGFKFHEGWGKASVWGWAIGFYVTFIPKYILGFLGMPRRLSTTDNPLWDPYLYISVIGVACITAGILCFVIGLVVSIVKREQLKDVTGDPWDGRTLEWATASPPPFYNFAVVPDCSHLDAFHEAKKVGLPPAPEHYEAIHMPKNTCAGVFISLLGGLVGTFALTWHIWWLAIVGFVGMVVFWIARSYDQHTDFYVQPDEIARIETAHQQAIASQA